MLRSAPHGCEIRTPQTYNPLPLFFTKGKEILPGSRLYRTANGERILLGAERQLFEESLAMMVDFLSDNDCEFGVHVFDQLQRGQKLFSLYRVARAEGLSSAAESRCGSLAKMSNHDRRCLT